MILNRQCLRKLLVLSMGFASTAILVPVLASPAEEFPVWAEREAKQFASQISLPTGFDSKAAGGLRAVIQFHVSKAGRVSNFKIVRNDGSMMFSKVTISEKQFTELENSLINAVKKSEPLNPVPASFLEKGEGVKFCFSPNSETPFKVTVISEQKL